MKDNYILNGKHLTESEFLLIEAWDNKEKISNREISYRLGKAPQAIHNEIYNKNVFNSNIRRSIQRKSCQERYKTLRVHSIIGLTLIFSLCPNTLCFILSIENLKKQRIIQPKHILGLSLIRPYTLLIRPERNRIICTICDVR